MHEVEAVIVIVVVMILVAVVHGVLSHHEGKQDRD
jgi:uncharacterized membrane protein affecting hemolysin expression